MVADAGLKSDDKSTMTWKYAWTSFHKKTQLITFFFRLKEMSIITCRNIEFEMKKQLRCLLAIVGSLDGAASQSA